MKCLSGSSDLHSAVSFVARGRNGISSRAVPVIVIIGWVVHQSGHLVCMHSSHPLHCWAQFAENDHSLSEEQMLSRLVGHGDCC